MNAFAFRDQRDLPPRTAAEREQYEGAPALDGDVPEWARRAPRSAGPALPRLPLIDTTKWIGCEPKPIPWIVEGWLPRGVAGLLIGKDGVGKSTLAQMLATSVGAGRPFLGLNVTQAPALYVTCEDPENVLHRRQRDINPGLNVPVDAAPAAMVSMLGALDVEMMLPGETGLWEPTQMFGMVQGTAQDMGAGLIVLDNLAHLFAGNEIARRDVRAFMTGMDRLAIACNAAVLLLGHPAKGRPGEKPSEYSGSGAWSAHARSRWFMERPDDAVRDRLKLRNPKNNWGRDDGEIDFWRIDGSFIIDRDIPDDRRAGMDEAARAGADNGIFLDCLDERERLGLSVSANVSPSYAPTQFTDMIQSKGIGRDRLKLAMARLLSLGTIEQTEAWNVAKSRKVGVLRRVEQ